MQNFVNSPSEEKELFNFIVKYYYAFGTDDPEVL